MLEITVPAADFYDSVNERFVSSNETKLILEHSLLSISKWEAITNKALLREFENKTIDQNGLREYIRCMTINKQSSPLVYSCLTVDNYKQIIEYMNLPMTATTINNRQKGPRSARNKIVTSEVIYSWMVINGIPFECEKWHINRLLTLIEVCVIESGGNKKMSKRDTMMMYSELNAQRRAQLHTSG